MGTWSVYRCSRNRQSSQGTVFRWVSCAILKIDWIRKRYDEAGLPSPSYVKLEKSIHHYLKMSFFGRVNRNWWFGEPIWLTPLHNTRSMCSSSEDLVHQKKLLLLTVLFPFKVHSHSQVIYFCEILWVPPLPKDQRSFFSGYYRLTPQAATSSFGDENVLRIRKWDALRPAIFQRSSSQVKFTK